MGRVLRDRRPQRPRPLRLQGRRQHLLWTRRAMMRRLGCSWSSHCDPCLSLIQRELGGNMARVDIGEAIFRSDAIPARHETPSRQRPWIMDSKKAFSNGPPTSRSSYLNWVPIRIANNGTRSYIQYPGSSAGTRYSYQVVVSRVIHPVDPPCFACIRPRVVHLLVSELASIVHTL